MKLSAVAQTNKGVKLPGARLVVIGGTQGIGEGVACRFAEAGAEVWIVGRNEAKATSVLERLVAISAEQNVDPPPKHAFLRADLSLVSEAKRVAGQIRNLAGSQGIHYLVMSQGGPPNGTFVLTSEGHEQRYAVQVLSRFVIAYELAGDPASSLVKEGIMSIMAPAQSFFFSTFDADDIGLQTAKARGQYGLFAALTRDSIVVDAFTEDLAKANPNVKFTHVFPGMVKTSLARNSNIPWYISLPSSFLLPILGASPRQYSEVPFYLLAHSEGRAQTALEMFIDEKLTKLEPTASFKDENVRGKIRTHLLNVITS